MSHIFACPRLFFQLFGPVLVPYYLYDVLFLGLVTRLAIASKGVDSRGGAHSPPTLYSNALSTIRAPDSLVPKRFFLKPIFIRVPSSLSLPAVLEPSFYFLIIFSLVLCLYFPLSPLSWLIAGLKPGPFLFTEDAPPVALGRIRLR